MDTKRENQFHFPAEIDITRIPLVEAWLDIKWVLEKSDIPGLLLDKAFPFALGVFYNNVKDKYTSIEELDASKAPEGMLPNAPQYRFRAGDSGWPLIQLGPGIGTVNFTQPYTWKIFKKEALYLQKQLVDAYKSNSFKVNTIVLHYRNAYPFNFSKDNLFTFLSEKLNTTITLPNHIPGTLAKYNHPTTTNLDFNFEITDPASVCTIKYGTGIQKEELKDKTEVFLWEYELSAIRDQVPDFNNKEQFSIWLEKAHSVIHEWFFSTIDGKLFQELSPKKDK